MPILLIIGILLRLRTAQTSRASWGVSVGWKFFLAACCCGLLAAIGCSRGHYRLRADGEAYAVLTEKSAATPWEPPPGFTVVPDQRSRFFDATPTDDPLLPVPAPQLYAYALPDLPTRDPGRFYDAGESGAEDEFDALGSRLTISDEDDAGDSGHSRANDVVRPVSFTQSLPSDDAVAPVEAAGEDSAAEEEEGGGDRIVPIPTGVWQGIPRSCLIRMLEFQYVRGEYEMTFGEVPGGDMEDPSPRLTLEDIVDLAVINSREYQTQKERLYRAALGLTLDRFDYDLKFATSGNRSAANYSQERDRGDTLSTLGIPTLVTGDKLLATGGDLLARFANSVLLTFGGPSGFDADIGSELLFDLSQSFLQRDIVLEGLTQAERNVVYAARDFARYRKTMFASLADQYYRLLLAYRAIEIDSRDYFSNQRGYEQGQAEFQFANVPRFQVDQFEQQALESRRRLIGTCNTLENLLDRLKIDMGIPTETPVNLDLSELNLLTLRDEATAAVEGISRAKMDLSDALDEQPPSRKALINAAVNMTKAATEYMEVCERLTGRPQDTRDLLEMLTRLRLADARLSVEKGQAELDDASTGAQPMKLTVVGRTMDLTGNLIHLLQQQLELAKLLAMPSVEVEALADDLQRLAGRHDAQVNLKVELGPQELLDQEDQLLADASDLLMAIRTVVGSADQLLQIESMTDEEKADQAKSQAEKLLAEGQRFIDEADSGLTPLEVDVDDAMLTALTCRFDLMNQREELADAWRRIKLAGDDLKSILNLHVTHRIRTAPDYNRPFDFRADDSTTRVALTFDAPLNRKAQRNAYRRALIDYNAGIRALIAAEDGVKLEIRDRLRAMQLNREQYLIAVKSTALAHSRLASTRLQLEEGIKNVTARDVLESQRAYTQSLTRLAADHISYIQNRIRLFLELEELQVDAAGFWPGLYDDRKNPDSVYYLETYGRPVYGELPCGVLPSRKMRRMVHVPPGETAIFQPQADAGSAADAPTAPLPPLPGE